MSFILLLFHTLIFLITLARNKIAAQIHDGCWGFKALLVAGGYFGSWWIPSDFMNGYYQFAKYVSAIFLLYQVLLILSAAYQINDTLVNNVNQDNGKCSSIIIIAMTICCFAGDIAWIVMSFIEFQCTDAVIWQVITLVVIVLAFAVQLLGRAREDASILTTGLAALYFQYL